MVKLEVNPTGGTSFQLNPVDRKSTEERDDREFLLHPGALVLQAGSLTPQLWLDSKFCSPSQRFVGSNPLWFMRYTCQECWVGGVG